MKHLSPVNRRHHDEATFSQRAADRAAAFVGSWAFIGWQTTVILVWIGANVWMLSDHGWDPYPFILLNLAFSTQAAYAAPILQLAANRSAERDRLKAENDYAVNREALTLLKENASTVSAIARHLDVL